MMGLVLRAVLICAFVATPWSAGAVVSCKARVDGKDGAILVSARDVRGPLSWGTSASSITNPFVPPSCVANGVAHHCRLGARGSARAVTPPAGCTLYLADEAGTVACPSIKGCTPGGRTPGVAIVDAAGTVLGPYAVTSNAVIRTLGSTTMAFPLAANAMGFFQSLSLYYVSGDCSGAPLLYVQFVDNASRLIFYGQALGDTLYYAAAPRADLTAHSMSVEPSTQADCSGGVFAPPDKCCFAIDFPGQFTGVATESVVVVPPVHVEVE